MKKSLLLLWLGVFLAILAKADTEPANNTAATTTDVLTMGGSQAGSFGGADNYDYFQLQSTADGNITISLINDNNAYTYIYLFDSNGTSQLGATVNFAGAGISFTANGLAAGNYYAMAYSTALTNYTISASLNPVSVANDAEPNNIPAQALPLPINSSVEGHISHRFNGGNYDTDDYYLLTTGTDGNISISLTNTNNAYTYIYLYDIDGTTLLGSTVNFAGSGISFTANGLAAGTYYARVYGGSAYSGYTLNATLIPNTIVNDNVNNSYFANAIPFAQNDSITGHIAYRNNGGSIDNYDYYSFYSNGDYDITVNLINDNNNYTYIYLYDTDTTTQLGSAVNYAGGGISFTTAGLAAGTYYIAVYAGGGSYSGYTLKNLYTPNPIIPDIEPNNTIATATTVSYNSVNTGHIAYRNTGGTYDNYDHYVFTTPVDGDITLSLTNTNNAYTYLYLYDSDGVSQLASVVNYAQAGISFTKGGLAAGTYYAVVYAGGGSYSGYTLTKTLTPSPFTADSEPNATIGNALTMAVNSSVNGHISHRNNGGTYDDYDYYKIVTTQDGSINLNLTNNNNAYTYLYLYDSDGTTQLGSTVNYAQGGIGFTRTGLAAGTYYAVVYAGSAYSSYTLSNTLNVAPYNNDTENNNVFATASLLNNNASKEGHIGYRYNGGVIDDYDNWKITMNATDSLRLDLTFTSGNYHYVYLYNSSFSQIYANAGYGDNSIFFNSLAAGDYYLVVYSSSFDSYRINNFYYPCDATPSIISSGGPTTFCASGTVSLNSVNAYSSYQWSNGATTGSINVSSSGNYILTAYDYDACPHVSNLIAVNVNPAPTPVITAGGPLTFCNGGSVSLHTSLYASYLWSTGATSQSINVSASGLYSVTVTDGNGCTGTSASETVNVNANPATPVINASGPLTFCSNSSVTLSAPVSTGYLWSTGATTQSINVTTAGTFTVTVTNASGCTAVSASVTTSTIPLQTYYRDFDNDTYGNSAVTIQDCSAPSGYVSNSLDCHDNNNAVNPAATELCNGFDDDCDGTIDEGCGTFTFYFDFDNDTYGDLNNSITSSNPVPPSGYVTNSADCNDNNASVNPGATEVCNSIDDDCDGSVDEGVQLTFYADSDNDNYGNASATTLACSAPSGFVSNSTDCNDNNASVNPGATEVCNSIDDDCDGSVDEGVQLTFYADNDNDNYGNASVTTLACSAPSGYVSNSSDCNDNNSAVNPGATEICNSIDDDCDGTTDEGCNGCSNPPTVFAGNDQSICSGDNAALNATIGGGASSVTWSSTTGGTFMPNVNSVTATYVPSATDIANGFVRLYITTDFPSGCNPAIDSIDVTILDLLEAPGIISGSQYICNPSSGSTYTYSVATVPGATGYNWTAGPSASIISGQGSNTITVKFTPSAIHNGINANICVAATGPGSCGVSSISCLAVSVQAVAPVTPGSISGANKACPGDTIIYSVSFVSRVAYYNWTVPSTASIVEGQGTQIIKVAYDATFNGGIISVAAVNGCGSSPLRSRVILFNTLPAPGTIGGQSSGLCNEQNVMYSITPVAGASSYQWTIPSQGSFDGPANGNSITVDYGSFVTGNISVAGVNGCGAGVARLLTVTGTPASAGLITGPVLVCAGQTRTYQVATVTGATGYNWTVPSGTTIMNGQGTKIIDLKFGNVPAYNQVISVRTSNACGNGNLRSLSSIATLFCTRNASMSEVIVSPNPSNGIFKVDLFNSASNEFTLQVIDISGKVILNTRIENTESYILDLSDYKDGLYMLRIQSEEINEMIKLIKN